MGQDIDTGPTFDGRRPAKVRVAGRHSSEWRPGFGELTMKLEIRAGFLGERDVPPREPEIRAVLAACLFHSEGHRNAHARLRAKAIRVGRKRVLRLMRAQHRLAPSRPRHEHGDRARAGTLITTDPDELWGTDAPCFYTEREW